MRGNLIVVVVVVAFIVDVNNTGVYSECGVEKHGVLSRAMIGP